MRWGLTGSPLGGKRALAPGALLGGGACDPFRAANSTSGSAYFYLIAEGREAAFA